MPRQGNIFKSEKVELDRSYAEYTLEKLEILKTDNKDLFCNGPAWN